MDSFVGNVDSNDGDMLDWNDVAVVKKDEPVDWNGDGAGWNDVAVVMKDELVD